MSRFDKQRQSLISILCAMVWIACSLQLAAQNSSQDRLRKLVDENYASLFTLYKHLHANPELSRHEAKTAERIAKELASSGFQVTPGVGGHGVVGVLKNGSGPILMIRTDLDALPVVEETGLEYASRVRTSDEHGREVGVMHACGHDVHMTCFVGTAKLLSSLKDRWQGTLVMIGQPAEERGTGAKAMLDDGLFRTFPVPDFALALHVNAGLEAGKVGLVEGNALAGVDSVDLTIRGVSGHGAYPFTTKDPIMIAAQTIMALQTIVSREIPAIEPAVVTVGSIHGGTKHNIIPDEVQLQLTIRHYTDEMRQHILQSIERIAKGVAQTAGVPSDRYPIIKLTESVPTTPTYNDPELTRKISRSMEKVLGKQKVVSLSPVMGGEDFGRYGRTAEKIPISIFWLGTISPEKISESQRSGTSLPSLHSSIFAPVPELTIKTGVLAMTSAALDLLSK